MRKMPVLTLLSLAAVMALAVTPVMAQVNITNGPEIDNNNRIVGEEGGNIFYNGIAPGGTLTSVEPLGGLGAIGVTPDGGVTASSFVTIGEVSLDAERNRSTSVEAQGDNTAVLDGQLTATLNADGSYAVTAADGFDSDYIVTFGAVAGDSVGAVHLLAAPATNVDLSGGAFLDATGLDQADVELSADEAVFNLAPGSGRLVYTSAVEVGEDVTVSADYNASSADGLTVAVGAFDGSVPQGLRVNYDQVMSTNVEAGVTKNVASSFKSFEGSVVPFVQVTNSSDAEMTVTVSNVQVINARPLPDYALDPNVTADGVPGTDTTDGWLTNINNQSVGSFSTEDGALVLDGTEGDDTLINVYAQATVDGGVAVAECYAQNSGNAGDGAFLALVLTDGATSSANTYVPASSLPTDDSMNKITTSATFSGEGPAFVVVQAFDFVATVENIVIRLVTDSDFDANLIP